MRVVDQAQWGFLLEHEQSPFFIPFGNKNPLHAMFSNQVKMKRDNGEDLVVVVKGNDKPFWIDKEGNGHIIYEDGPHAKYIPEIKQAIVHFLMSNARRKAYQ